MDQLHLQHRTVAQIDLAAIRHNGLVARRTFSEQMILSVLKADAYGHGIAGVLPAYETFTDWYAVATIEEALLIRESSSKPILLFGPVPVGKMILGVKNDLTFTVGSLSYAITLSKEMQKTGLCAKCHLKIDTGLNRSGIRWRAPDLAMDQIRQIMSLPGLRFTGTYSHLACGEGMQDWEIAHTKQQMDRFFQACQTMENEGYCLGIRHCCSTGGALVNPLYRLDMVRLGMLPMGMSYSDTSADALDLIPAMKWISFIAQIEDVSPGEAVSYGCTYRASGPMRMGIVTCGYADGYRRIYSNKTEVIAGGKRVPVIGRVAMDYLMIDLTDLRDAYVGMPVVLLGSEGTHRITAFELSQFGESVSGEVTSVISSRVPRIYVDTKKD